ncbi:Rgg/GadR/MutR family transcriptional regulator [Liquorilactobacillus mali]|uniref:Transcription regulator n=1 Tax=Liquorilactobacillus mali TaxID=1618 RepID=A0A0R2FQM7_9LACO|nr:Rgg/GadR/MutR family transcriptional regulator [Liquorilactobacillus mali]KRN26772.1 transcription regulator [Liquorilactobacillus mali]MDN7144931.1 Rgg/GadR/MutR family transcriptional regulator [Liquorilactobacillus mali]
MKTGELVKQIRTEKGIKAKVVYDGLLSRSMYYKYESGLVETTADTFLYILNRLNIEADEFLRMFSVMDKCNNEYINYRDDLNNAYRLENLIEIKALEKKISKEYQESGLVRFYNLMLIAAVMRKKLGKTAESVLSERKEILHYLLRSTKWGHYEYGLFIDAIFMFDSSSIEKVLQDHDWDDSHEGEDMKLDNLKVKALCQSILVFMKSNKTDQVNYYYTLLDKIKVSSNNIYALGNKRFFEGLKTINNGDYEQGLKTISEIFSLYQELGLDDLYKEHVAILQELLSVQLQKSKSRKRRKA